MTEEQLNHIDFSVNTQLRVLQLVKQQYHNNEWSIKFNELVNETKEKLIWDLENYLLLPDYTFNPITRNFRNEDFHLREEISLEVNRLFQIFREAQN